MFVEPLNVQPVGMPPPAVKPGAKAPAPASKPEANDEAEKNTLRKAYRELVSERANHLVRKEVRGLREIATRCKVAAEREISKFYKRFSEASPEHVRQSRSELNEYLSAGEDFEALFVKWETERVAQIVAKEMVRWC